MKIYSNIKLKHITYTMVKNLKCSISNDQMITMYLLSSLYNSIIGLRITNNEKHICIDSFIVNRGIVIESKSKMELQSRHIYHLIHSFVY